MSHSAIAAPDIANRDVPVQDASGVRRRSRLLRPVLMVGGVAVVAAGALYFWINGGRVISIDNAYVRADKLGPVVN